MSVITLTRLTDDDREQFILDNQRAFRYGAMEEFGMRDDHLEEDGEIISRRTIENSIDGGAAYRIREDGRIVGGLPKHSYGKHVLRTLRRGISTSMSTNAGSTLSSSSTAVIPNRNPRMNRLPTGSTAASLRETVTACSSSKSR